ncbi:MAG: transposase [Planctomycetes bacterium]|nr:transposase [Planctomycetota bacterium]
MRDFWPKAWLLTWTTYGTWLHGDDRGSWDRKRDPEATEFVAPNIRLLALRRSQLKREPLVISPAMRKVVREAIEQDCEFRKRHLYALNVHSNHVHAVIANVALPEKLLHAIKACATRQLRKAQLIGPDRPVWTTGGSHTWLFNDNEFQMAVDYVRNQQGDPLPET